MKGGKVYLGRMVLAVAVMLATACTKEKLDDRKPLGYFEIELSNDSGFGNQAGVHDDEAEDCSRIYIYSAEGDKPLVLEQNCKYEDAEMRHVFRGTLPVGKYHVITMNTRHTNAELKHEKNYETARIDVMKADQAVAVTKADGALIGEPATVFLTHQHKIKGEETLETLLEIKDRETVKAETTPQSMIKRISFTIALENPLAADACSAVFSGISQAVKCSTCECIPTNPANAQLMIERDPAAPRNLFRATLNLFGLVPTGNKTHMLDLTLTIDGKDYRLSPPLDLSAEVEKKLKELEDQGLEFTFEIPLNLEIKVKRDIDGELKASVKGWDDGGTGSGMGGV